MGGSFIFENIEILIGGTVLPSEYEVVWISWFGLGNNFYTREVSYIELNIHDEQKYVSVWLTKAESGDPVLRVGLKSLYFEYKQKKYRVVVFESGKGDLPTLTKALLKHNIELSAKREIVL